MPKFVEVDHRIWIDAPQSSVKAQFADLDHHIRTNVHPKLRFEVLERSPTHARFTQEVRLLGVRQRDVFQREVRPDGSIRDLSVEGFNEGGSLDFHFTPEVRDGHEGTGVDILIRLPLPPLLGWLAPVLKSQVRREVTAAALEDKYDLEQRGYPNAAMA